MSHASRAVIACAVFGIAKPAMACSEFAGAILSGCCSMAMTHFPKAAGPGGGGSLFTGPENYPSKNVSLLSNLPLAQIGGGKGSSLYGWVDPLTRREYAIMGRSNGTAFIDVTNPTQPRYVANLPMATGSVATDWREPKVYGNHVYVGVDRTDHPIQVVDLTKLRNYSGTPLTLAADSNFRGNGTSTTWLKQAHTLAINHDSGFLYAAGSNKYSGGLMAIDVRNPLSPVEVGGFSGDGYTHETQVVIYNGPDAQYRGREIAFNSNAKSGAVIDTFSIVDVTNKTSMTRLASKTYPGARWIHQGWLTEDHRYFFQNDEFDETGGVTGGKTRTHLWDVQDLDNPSYKGFWDNTTTSVDHNLYVKDGYVYQTNYTTGLRILKIGNLDSSDSSEWLTEVAFFDTYPANDAATFNGAWNNYPFLPSGNVLVSDIEGGLFVLRPELGGFSMHKKLGDDVLFQSVPEPGSVGLMATGFVTLVLRRRRCLRS
jgi:choice-of-anchor B domain-containing protein